MDATADHAETHIAGPIRKEGVIEQADFEKLVDEQAPRLRGLAWNFGVPPHEVDDALQEIFIRAWSARKTFRGDAQAATWLTRIAVNYLTSRRRTLARRLRLIGRPAVDAEVAARGVSAEAAEAHARVMDAVARLPQKLRRVFVLRYLEEMPCAEVAAVLDIPEATVRTRVYHGRRKLREMMEEDEP